MFDSFYIQCLTVRGRGPGPRDEEGEGKGTATYRSLMPIGIKASCVCVRRAEGRWGAEGGRQRKRESKSESESER